MAFLVAQMVKNLPEIQETWVQSLGQENPLEKGIATLSSCSYFFFFTFLYSCLRNSMGRGFWWVAIYGVAKIQT